MEIQAIDRLINLPIFPIENDPYEIVLFVRKLEDFSEVLFFSLRREERPCVDANAQSSLFCSHKRTPDLLIVFRPVDKHRILWERQVLGPACSNERPPMSFGELYGNRAG